MTASSSSSNLGRHLFGAAAFGFGVITLIWHDYHDWDSLRHILGDTAGPIFIYLVAAAQLFGGVTIQFDRTAKIGAGVLSVVYLVFALTYLPGIVAAPQTYNPWGNFFEQFSLVTGPAIVYAYLASAWSRETLERVARIAFGISTASFALEQAFYINPTASLVPNWLPPSPMFWAVATTVFFALAAVALVTNLKALLATRLLTAMLLTFGLLVWVPILLSGPPSHANWSETIETFAIAGVAWILADLLAPSREPQRR